MNTKSLCQILTVVFGLVVASHSPAHSWGWLQGPPDEPVEPPEPDQIQQLLDSPSELPFSQGNDAAICIRAILEAEQRYNIPNHLLLALGLQEAGYKTKAGLTVWPWSINAAGEGRRFKSADSAMAFVKSKLSQGVTSIDVGCMQINLRWHPDAFASLSHGFDPKRNVDYAARFLLGLRQDSPDWWTAAGRYHSWSEGPQSVYLSALKRNHQVAQTQFAKFVQLAALSPDAFASQDWPDFEQETAPPPPPNYRTEGAIWGADIAGDEGSRRTLYSADEIQPILPQFIESEI